MTFYQKNKKRMNIYANLLNPFSNLGQDKMKYLNTLYFPVKYFTMLSNLQGKEHHT